MLEKDQYFIKYVFKAEIKSKISMKNFTAVFFLGILKSARNSFNFNPFKVSYMGKYAPKPPA